MYYAGLPMNGGTMKRLPLLLLLIAAPAFAGNGMSGVPTVLVERQMTSVAVKAIVGGDNDSSAVLRIFQRWYGATTFDTGMVMIRRPHGGGSDAAHSGEIFEGRILFPPLPCGIPQTGRIAEWYIEATDAGGKFDYKSAASPDTVSLQPIRQIVASGPVYYVSQANGNDNNAGTKSRPKKTVNAALVALAGSAGAGANGGIFIGPGEYHERLDLDSAKFPTDGPQRFLEGDSPNRDSTIICGANELVERGLYAPGKPISWKFTGQDSTYFCRFPASGGPADSTMLIVLGWGERLLRKTSLLAVLNDSTYTGDSYSYNGGELSGWFWQNDTLYVKRVNGRSPSGQKLHFGYRDQLIAVQRRNWRIANLTIRFAGGTNGDPTHLANCRPPVDGSGIVLGSGLSGGRSASGLVVDSCTFYGFDKQSIYSPHYSGSIWSDTVVVVNSAFSGPGLGYMDFSAGKGRTEELSGRITLLARAVSFFNNTVFDLHNGLETGAGEADSTWGSQGEIVGNTFHHIVDDCLEPDSSHAINTLVANNLMRDSGSSGISIMPIYTGPLFMLYNTIQDTRLRGIRCGGGTKGKALVVHNTIVSKVSGCVPFEGLGGGDVDGFTCFNNIFSTRDATYVIAGPGTSSFITNGFNYDFLGGTNNTYLLAWQGGAVSTLFLVQLLSNWEKNGLSSTDPAVVDSTLGNLSLAPASACVRAGRRATGINTWLDGLRYQVAPDLGSEQRVTP
jgi:hypothetical protein